MTASASFTITYRIQTALNESIHSKVEAICLEQTVELPRSVISDDIHDRIVAKPEAITQESESVWRVTARYPLANVGDEITQFLNVLFGNVSLVPGVRILDVSWSDIPASILPGPAHGIQGVRAALGIPKRALSCTALKPVGFSSTQLAELAFEFAMGGIDLIKDDHGLANQVYSPFDERLKRCIEAVNKANSQTGFQSWYIPHISAPGDELWRRYELAKAEGAGAVMICPQFCSPEVMSEIAKQNGSIPIMAHPAFSGSFIMDSEKSYWIKKSSL